MLHVALVSAPLTPEERYGHFAGAGSREPAAALAYLGAVVRGAGHKVSLLDASAEGMSVDEAAARVIDIHPQVVGLTTTTLGINASAELAGRIKKDDPDIVTVVGGCHVTALPKDTLREFPSFDVGVTGEGEITFSELLREIDMAGAVPKSMPGTVVRDGADIRLNARREPIANLDELPLPAWDLLDGFPDRFHPSPARVRRMPCASIVLTRGCPYHCRFCDRSVFGNRVRSYSTDYAIRMLKDLRDQHGVREILIEDDTFVVARSRMEDFCKRMIEERMDLSWSCLGRADRVTEDLLRLMRRAGCWHISFGVESGDPRILEAMNKKEDLSQIRSAVQWAHSAGLKTKGFFMIGFPRETKESLALTRKIALELPLDDISVMQLTPFPGSDIYADIDHYGIFDRDWRKMNILTTVFVPNGFTKESLDRARADLLRAFYFRLRILFAKALDVIKHPRMFGSMFRALMTLLRVSSKGGAV